MVSIADGGDIVVLFDDRLLQLIALELMAPTMEVMTAVDSRCGVG